MTKVEIFPRWVLGNKFEKVAKQRRIEEDEEVQRNINSKHERKGENGR